jgi:hypothetical protein
VICFAAPQAAVTLTADGGAEVLCTKSSLSWKDGPPLQDFYAGMEYDSGEPAVTVNRYGKGKAIYICGDVGVAAAQGSRSGRGRWEHHHRARGRDSRGRAGAIGVTAFHVEGPFGLHLAPDIAEVVSRGAGPT